MCEDDNEQEYDFECERCGEPTNVLHQSADGGESICGYCCYDEADHEPVTDGGQSSNDTERFAWRIRNDPRGYEPVDHIREADIYANAAEPDPASKLTIVWPRDSEADRDE